MRGFKTSKNQWILIIKIEIYIFIYLAKKSLAVSDNSDGISGDCFSFPSLNISAYLLSTLWNGLFPVAISMTVHPTLQIST